MTPLSFAGRALVGWLFVHAGVRVLRTPGPATALSAPALASLRRAVPVLPADDELIVRANAAVHVLAGVSLAIGRPARLPALVLAASLIPTTTAGHSFWTAKTPLERRAQRAHFDKNVAIFGGLLVAAGAQSRTGARTRPTVVRPTHPHSKDNR